MLVHRIVDSIDGQFRLAIDRFCWGLTFPRPIPPGTCQPDAIPSLDRTRPDRPCRTVNTAV